MTRGVSGALEMANTLRGSDFFYDFYEDPDALKELLKSCAHALLWYYDKQLEAAGQVFGGTITGFGEWLPRQGRGTALRGHHDHEPPGRNSRNSAARSHRRYARIMTLPSCTRMRSANIHFPPLRLSRASVPWSFSPTPTPTGPSRSINATARRWRGLFPVLRLTRGEIESNFELLKSQKTIVWYDASCMEDAQDMAALFAREFPVR